MLLKTILNSCQRFKSFVYSKVSMEEFGGEKVIEVKIRPRKNARPICSCCGQAGPVYDTMKEERRFEFIPLWGFLVYFLYFMRRVDCCRCGVKIEEVPWGSGKRQLTKTYMQYLAHWAKKISWTEVADSFRTSWEKVFHAVEYMVSWGLERRDLSGITAIGVDEIQWHRGHKYLTLVYQINSGCIRLLWIGTDRTAETLLKFFDFLGREMTQKLKYICSDMWKAYIKIIKEKASQAIHILDRFHIVAKINKAIDEVRAGEYRQMTEQGYEPILKHTRWCLLKRPGNLTEKQQVTLGELLRYNLKSVRAYLLKEDFQGFWDYVTAGWADKFIDHWCKRVMRSRIEPMKKIAKTIRSHKELILNWFRAKKEFSCGIVEGLNTKVKLTVRKSYGFRTLKCTEIALYHALGKLPEPRLTHRFY